ncbi:hypothetical protein EDD99_0208 [Streptomyces sp. 846.5]|nr:hypothetical protein [Streptomyces sp. 846.5]TDU01829.1 hypothetical protein EDD99_0208 [Streptomyces sp. 846.5]
MVDVDMAELAFSNRSAPLPVSRAQISSWPSASTLSPGQGRSRSLGQVVDGCWMPREVVRGSDRGAACSMIIAAEPALEQA